MTFEKKPPTKGAVSCLTCGSGSHELLSMDRILAVGFGDASYSCDGSIIWHENPADEAYDCPRAGDIEYLASLDPDKDWRIVFDAPLYSATYQRQGLGHWVLISKGRGFA